MSEPFSLLITVYGGDRADRVAMAFRSAVDAQTRRPNQVILIQDGPVGDDLAECLRSLVADSPVPVDFARLDVNGGLGPALDLGLGMCAHDIVARMDADDVAMPHRFEMQIPLVEAGADLVGAGLLEFGEDTGEVVGRRIPLSDPSDIARYARFHDPFNHPTVVYRRAAVLAAGGYGELPLMEDYWLFARMIASGARVANVPEPLVYYRVGAGAYERRGGWALLRSELRLQREFRRSGFVTRTQYVRNTVLRGSYRLIPGWLRRFVYRRAIAPYGARRNPVPPGGSASPSVPEDVS